MTIDTLHHRFERRTKIVHISLTMITDKVHVDFNSLIWKINVGPDLTIAPTDMTCTRVDKGFRFTLTVDKSTPIKVARHNLFTILPCGGVFDNDYRYCYHVFYGILPNEIIEKIISFVKPKKDKFIARIKCIEEPSKVDTTYRTRRKSAFRITSCYPFI